ncbi:MAG: HEPN domain-containing protein [Anaerolineales bacterium]|nr:HEPN domain-containing protein [Anaerolineales bacterium]
MPEEILAQNREVSLYMANAQEMLEAAQLMLDNGFYASAVNRAYYGVFYAANALLATKRLARNKHSGVISAFRGYFVKTGFIEDEYSDTYGRLFDDCHISDYDMNDAVEDEQIFVDVDDARRFVARMAKYLTEVGWL